MEILLKTPRNATETPAIHSPSHDLPHTHDSYMKVTSTLLVVARVWRAGRRVGVVGLAASVVDDWWLAAVAVVS
jgi:hypothetical protein